MGNGKLEKHGHFNKNNEVHIGELTKNPNNTNKNIKTLIYQMVKHLPDEQTNSST